MRSKLPEFSSVEELCAWADEQLALWEKAGRPPMKPCLVIEPDGGKTDVWSNGVTDFAPCALARVEEIQTAAGYGEPGYTCGEKGIVLGNWNSVDLYYHESEVKKMFADGVQHAVFEEIVLHRPTDRLMRMVGDRLEELGYETEWDDEWVADDNRMIYRVCSDSYEWTRSYVEIDGEIVGRDVLLGDPDRCEEYLQNRMRLGVRSDSLLPVRCLREMGFEPVVENLQRGFHEGMDDDPGFIGKQMEKEEVEDWIIHLDETSQFYVTFSLWARTEADKIEHLKRVIKTTPPGPGLAEKTEEALKSLSLENTPEGHVRVSIIRDGEVETKDLTHREFIEGKIND